MKTLYLVSSGEHDECVNHAVFKDAKIAEKFAQGVKGRCEPIAFYMGDESPERTSRAYLSIDLMDSGQIVT